jgi:3-isopropylmalate/(R)-2-methylmalate dehydratase small subunit
MGSSREHAPVIIKLSGISAVIAKSFARIFFRNAINIGLPAISCDTDQIEPFSRIYLNLKEGYVEDISGKRRIPFKPLPEIMLRILDRGGLVNYVKESRGLFLP